MGIQGFFKALKQRSREGNGVSSDISGTQNIGIDELYIDFNSIIHNASENINTVLALILYNIIHNKTEIEGSKNETDIFLDDYKGIMQNSTDVNTNIAKFREVFNDEKINGIIIEDTKKKAIEILQLIGNKKPANVYFMFDGVPNMGKIYEQKQRKYIGNIISSINKQIFDKNSIKDENRILFEKNKIVFDRSNISTWTKFMKDMSESLDQSWFDQINNGSANKFKFFVSGPEYPGEGEKKIMEQIVENIQKKQGTKYMIYSPDADVILLSIILRNIYYANKYSRKTNVIILCVTLQCK